MTGPEKFTTSDGEAGPSWAAIPEAPARAAAWAFRLAPLFDDADLAELSGPCRAVLDRLPFFPVLPSQEIVTP